MKAGFGYFVCSLFLQYGPTASETHDTCTFEFPTLNNRVSVEENKTTEVSFKLSDAQCTLPNNYTIEISKTSPGYESICRIRIRDAKHKSKNVCSYNENGSLTLKKNFTRHDNGTWILKFMKATENILANKTIYFDVTYPARVKTLTLQSPRQPAAQDDQVHVASPDESVQVNCSVDVGNPPVTVRLLNRHGTELPTQTGDGKTGTVDLKYDFSSVSCDHAGSITCEAKGGENKTATLLVTCPPSFEDTKNESYIADGDSAHLNFSIRTHSRNMTWNMTTLNSTEATRDCSSLHVTGSPPDLTVNVRLDNVTKQDQGRWRLTLTNAAGSGHFDFHLIVQKKPVPTTVSASESPNNVSKAGVPSPLETIQHIFIAIGALAVAVTITVTVVVCCVRRKNLRAKIRRYVATQRAGIEVPPNEGEEASAGPAKNEDYVDIHDIKERKRQAKQASAGPGKNEDYVDISDIKERKRQAKKASAGLAKNEDYVDINDIKERKRQAKKARQAHGGQANQQETWPATGASNCVDVNADGLMYVQLDFSGRTTRNVAFRDQPKTDYSKVNVKARDPPPSEY